MKIEKYKIPTEKANSGRVAAALHALKIGECVRVSTAADARSLVGNATSVDKQRGIKIVTRTDGDDLLAFIQPNP